MVKILDMLKAGFPPSKKQRINNLLSMRENALHNAINGGLDKETFAAFLEDEAKNIIRIYEIIEMADRGELE